MIYDSNSNGQGNMILIRKTAESKQLVVCLSKLPPKLLENDKPKLVKIVIRHRLKRTSINEEREVGMKQNPVRSPKERNEEYDRAHTRIFSIPRSSDTKTISNPYYIFTILLI